MINTTDNSIVKTWVTYTRVIDILSNPLTNQVYTLTSHEVGETVSIRNATDGSSLGKIKINHPSQALFNQKNNLLYVTSTRDNTTSVINSTDNSIIHTIIVGRSPIGLVLNPNNNLLYIPNFDDNTVSVINSTDNVIIDTIKVDENPTDLVLNPNNNLLYISTLNNKTISVINATNISVIDTIQLDKFPESLAVNPTTNFLYVANRGNNTVSVINSTDNSIVETIEVGGSLHIGLEPRYLYYDTINNLLYVGISNTISIIDGISNEVIANNIIAGTSLTKIVGEHDDQIYSVNQNVYYLSLIKKLITK
jgi:YVTN family beta-propeller protein